MAVADRNGLPVSICVESAAPHEVKLAVPTLIQMAIPEAPQNLIGEQRLRLGQTGRGTRRYGIELTLLRTAVTEKTEHKICAGCEGTVGVGRLRGCSPGYKTSADWLSGMNDTLRTFSGCFTLLVV